MKKSKLWLFLLSALIVIPTVPTVSYATTTLNVISGNEHLSSGWYHNNGYELTYSDTDADYFWGDSTTTGYNAAATAITDEGNAFNTTVVNGSGSAPANRPDLQDGGIGSGGNYAANTEWGERSVAVVWDLKDQYQLSGLDIVNHVEGSNHKLYKVQAWGRNDPSEAWTTITGNLTGLESTAMTWPTTSSAEIYRFNLSGTYRYLRVDMWTQDGYQINIEEMYIFGQKDVTFNKSTYSILDSGSQPINTVAGADDITVSGSVTNNTSSAIPCVAITAVYDSADNMIAVEISGSMSVPSGSTSVWSNRITGLGDLPAGACIKNFLWNGFASLVPYADYQLKQ